MSKFETKDSGFREEYASGMRRDTQEGKPRFDLVLAPVSYEDQLLTRWAYLMARGAEKYGERNWQEADSYEEHDRFVSSALRHMMQWTHGERDEDHAAAVMFNLMAAEYLKTKLFAYKKKEEPDAQVDEEGSEERSDSSSGDSWECPVPFCAGGHGQASDSASSGDISGSGSAMESSGDIQPSVYGWCIYSSCPNRASYTSSGGYYYCDIHRGRVD